MRRLNANQNLCAAAVAEPRSKTFIALLISTIVALRRLKIQRMATFSCPVNWATVRYMMQIITATYLLLGRWFVSSNIENCKLGCVPYFVTKHAIAQNTIDVQIDVVALRRVVTQGKAQCICTTFCNTSREIITLAYVIHQ